MIDPDRFRDPAALSDALKAIVDLDCETFLRGPSGGDRPMVIDTIFATRFEVAMADLGCDAGLTVALTTDTPLPACMAGDVLLEDDSTTYRKILGTEGETLGVGAFHDGISFVGLYTGCTLCVHPDHRNRGIGTRLVMLRFIMDGSLPLWDHDKIAYSPEGQNVHLQAFDALMNLASTEGT